MKVIVFGAGAMGTLFGTTLVKAGHSVTFVDTWQPLIYAMSRDPTAHLRAESLENIPVRVVSPMDCPEESVDLVIIFVKSSATHTAMNALVSRHAISDNTVILTLQGGLDNPDIISQKIPNQNLLLTGRTKSFGKSVGLMTIENFGIRTTTVWPYRLKKEDSPDERIQFIVNECNKAGLEMELTPTAITDRWKMLVTYPTNAAISAVCGLTYGDVWQTEEGKNLLFELAKEVAHLAKLEGIDETLFNERIAISTVTDTAQENPERPGTMLLDYHAKRITEIDATAGAMVRKARTHGVNLPCMFTVWSIMKIKEENYGNEYDIANA